MSLRLPVLLAVLAAATLSFPSPARANHLWHDVNGGKLRGTFRELQSTKAVIQTSSKLVRIPFWNLIPEDQKFIARRMREWRQNDRVPGITDSPREWVIQGQHVVGQLLEVAGQELSIVVAGRKHQLSFEDLSPADIKYAQNWTQPVVQKSRVDRWDPFVTSPTDEAEPDETVADEESSPVSAQSASTVVAAETSPWWTRQTIRLTVTVLVCLTAFGWRVLRRFLPREVDAEI